MKKIIIKDNGKGRAIQWKSTNPPAKPIACMPCHGEHINHGEHCVFTPKASTPLKGSGGGGKMEYKNIDLSGLKTSSSCGGSEPCNGCSTHTVKGELKNTY